MSNVAASITLEQLDSEPDTVFARLRREDPVAWVPVLNRWLVTSWDEIRKVLSGWESYAAIAASPGAEICGPHTMLVLEGDRHSELRASVDHLFTEEAVPGVAAVTREAAARYAAALAGRGEADLMADYFRPAAVVALGRITGLDAVEPATLARWSQQMIAGFDNPTLDPDRTRTARRAAAEAAEAARPLAERVATTPDGSLLSHFTHSGCPVRGKRAMQEILPTVVDMISTFTEPAVMAGSALLALMQHPQQLHTVTTTPERMHDAVREAMRYWPVIGTLGRQAIRPATLAGREIKKGDLLAVAIASANRDENVYLEPDTFDIDRRAQPNSSLGYGRHRCLVAPIVPTLVATILGTLLEHIGEPQLDPESPAPNLHGWRFRELDSLPVRWTLSTPTAPVDADRAVGLTPTIVATGTAMIDGGSREERDG